MEDRLTRQTKEFDNLFNEDYSATATPEAIKKFNQALLCAEQEALWSYRSGYIRGLIKGRGLDEHSEEIIGGMNKTSYWHHHFSYGDDDFYSVDRIRQTSTLSSDCLLRFGIEYVDRWEMYYGLFKDISDS